MATTRPNQIKIAELDDSAKMLVVQPGENSQETIVPSIRAVSLPKVLSEEGQEAVTKMYGDVQELQEQITDVEQLVKNPADYIVTMEGISMYVVGERFVIDPPEDDPEAVTVDVENENLIFREGVGFNE